MVDDVAGTPQRVLGRSEELDRVDEMVERLAAGRGSVVTLIGPPGIGLTTLLREAIRRAGAGVETVRAVHVPSGLLEGDAGAALAAIASGGDGEAFRRAAEAAGQALSETGAATALDEPRLIRVALDALRALSSQRPLLLTMDDLPVTDESVFSALTSLAAGIAMMPVMVVLTSHVLPRSSYEDSPVGPLWVRRVPPLGPVESVELVRATAGRWVPGGVAATVGDRTGGNPGDVVAVCRALAPDQLAGLDPLPDMLPGTPVTTATYRRWWDSLEPPGRRLVLCAAVAVTADRARLEECAGATTADVVGPDGESVFREEDGLLVARDPRLLSAVHALTPSHALAATRSSLAGTWPQDALERHWQDIRSGTAPAPELLGRVVAEANALLDRGQAASVQSLVHDVVQCLGPATPPVELLVLGGVAALHCGHTGRAVTLLTGAVSGAPASLDTMFPPLLVAMTYRDRGVPHRLVSSCLGRLERAQPGAAVSVAALAARLCAELGDEPFASRYLQRAEALLPPEPDEDLADQVALARAMVGHRPPPACEPDALTVLASRRPGLDVVGWQLEMQRLGQLIEGRDWPQAHDALAELRARVQRCPAPLLQAQVAVLSVRLELAVCEYRRAEAVASAAVAGRLPLHVPLGGAGTAHMAQVALLRGRRAEAEGWLADLGELAQGYHHAPVLASALHETLGLRAMLDGDLAEATEHYAQALRGGSVLLSTLIDLVHLMWRGGTGSAEHELVVLLQGAGVETVGARGNESGGDPAPAIALALASAPEEALVAAVAAAARTARGAVFPALEAQLLELAADRVGALPEEQYALQARPPGPELPAGRDAYRLLLLGRARRLYEKCGATGRAAVTEREIARLERAPAAAEADLRQLTADELTIARLVHGGLTNRQVAGELYLSVRTVELRLTHIYRKLGIRSRRELRQLPGLGAVPEAAS
jgi:DNA-binding CsgD family transcriptional regulator